MATETLTFSRSQGVRVHRGCMVQAVRRGHGWSAVIAQGSDRPMQMRWIEPTSHAALKRARRIVETLLAVRIVEGVHRG